MNFNNNDILNNINIIEASGTILSAAALITCASAESIEDMKGRTPGSKNIPRERVHVKDIIKRLGKRNFRRAYRMTIRSFWILLDLIKPCMKIPRKRKRGKTPNGDISLSSQLSIALRWFAGGDPINIMQTHGVAFSEVYKSIWKIVDAINACKKLSIKFPNHVDQRIIAEGFKSKSWVEFHNCAGCIDGMLVWTNKPNKKTLAQCDIGPKKFYCGRKKKIGVPLQAVCDHKRKFIDIEIGFPASL